MTYHVIFFDFPNNHDFYNESCDGGDGHVTMLRKYHPLKSQAWLLFHLISIKQKFGFRANFRQLRSKNLNLDTWWLNVVEITVKIF